MIIISHRANLYGPDPSIENKPSQIAKALKMGFDVEIDVWKINDTWYLGHDEPFYEVDKKMLLNKRLWCHAKNIIAFEGLVNLGAICFWHQTDDCTFTTNSYIWTYPGKQLTPSSICVLPETTNQEFKICAGVCTDYPNLYKEKLNEIK